MKRLMVSRLFPLIVLMLFANMHFLASEPVFSERFTKGENAWTLNSGAKIMPRPKGGSLEITSQDAGRIGQASSPLISVEKAAWYELEYTVCQKTPHSRYILMPIIVYRQISLLDDTLFLDAPARPERRTVRFCTTPVQEKLELRWVTAAGGGIVLKDLALREIPAPPPPPAEIVLDMPYSHGCVFETAEVSEITGIVMVNSVAGTTLEVKVKQADDQEIFRQELAVHPGEEVRFAVPVPAVGTESLLEARLFDAERQELWRGEQKLAHHPHQAGQVTFRDDGVTLVDGKPFFMIAHWWFTRRGDAGDNVDWWYENDQDVADDMEFLKNAGFNTLLVRTPTHVRLAEEKGLKAIIEYPHKLPNNPQDKARAIQAYSEENALLRQNPALLAYYGPDEPLCFVCPFEKIMESSALVHKLDPYHPIFYNESPTGSAQLQHDYSLWCDVIGRDVYPIPGTPEWKHGDLPAELKLAAVGAHTDICRESVYERKPVWMILQAFAWPHIYGSRRLKKVEEITECAVPYPSYHQSRFMAYDAIVHGATGLMYHYLGYTVHVPEEFWRGLRDVLQELNFLSDVLTARTVTEPALLCNEGQVRVMVKRFDGTNYYLVVNESDQVIEASFHECPEAQLHILFREDAVNVEEGEFTLRLEPWDVCVMREQPFPKAAEILHPEKHLRYDDFPTLRGKADK